MARLATYSPALQTEMKLYSPVIENGKMLEMTNVSNGLNMWPLDEVVTQSALVNPDHVGWLTDQSSGQRRWAVIADMLFCLFPNNTSEEPVSVLVLPGHEIKSMLFKSAKRDSIHELQRGEPLSRTISGMLKHQFMIRNPYSSKEHVFALEDKSQRDQWVALLRVAANLDTDIFTESDDDASETSCCDNDENDVKLRNALNLTDSSQLDSTASSPEMPTVNGENKAARRRSSLSRSLSVHIIPQNDGSFSDTPTRRYIPSLRCSAEPRLTKHLSTLNISDNFDHEPAFIRRYSVQDVSKRSPDKIQEEQTDSTLTSKPPKQPKQSKKLSTWFNKDAQVRSIKEANKEQHLRPTHQRKKLSKTFARKMSSIRIKLKNGKVQEGVDMPRLGSIEEFTMSGYLKVKCQKKWSTMWCVIAQGNMYCYKSQSVHERPEYMLPLHQCSIQAVRNITDTTWCVFKVSHLNVYNTFFCTEDSIDYAQWMMVLKTESKVCDNIASPPSDTPNRTLSDEDSGSSTMSLHSDSRSETSFSDDLIKSRLTVRPQRLDVSQSSHDASLVMPNTQDVKMRRSQRNASESDTSTSDGELKTSHLATPNRRDSRPSRNMNNPLFATLYEHKRQIAAISELKLRRKGSDESMFSERSQGSMGSTDQLSNLSNASSPGRFSKTLTNQNRPLSKIQRLKARRNGPDLRVRSLTEPFSPVTSSPYSSHALDGSVLSQSSWNDHFVRGALNNSYSSFDSFHDHNTDDSESDLSSAAEKNNNVNELLKAMPGFRQSLTCKYTAPSTYDQNLRQVWKSGEYSPVGMLSATMPDRPAIYRRHLPGPNNEGILLVGDSMATQSPAKSRIHGGSFRENRTDKTLANRKKSLSDGNLCESLRRFQDSLKRVEVRDTIAARDIESPSVAGYLDRKVTGDHWNSCWCVLKDSSLYRYSSAVDEVTEDILLLHGYEVLRCPEIHGRDFAFELLHPDNPSELLAASNADELSGWMTKLKQATQHVSIEGLDLEPGAGGRQFSDGNCLKTPESRKVKHCSKQQLLQEVLQEKMRLEQSQRRKRKERSKLGDVFNNDDHSPLGSAASTPELSPDIVSLTSQTSCASIRVSGQSSQTHEQSLREISHLRQRKASTQLKVETLQRQLTITSKQKPKRFKLGLGGNKNTSASKETNQTGNVQIQKQLQALQSELDTISLTLEQKKKVALGDLGAVMDVKQNKKKGSNNNTPTEELPSNSRSSNGGTTLLLKDSKRSSLEGSSSVTNDNGNHSNKQEVCRTSSADPRLMNATVIRHSWDVNKDKAKEKSTKERANSCQPITRERAYTTPDDLNPPRPRQGSTSSQSEIDPAVMAQISAFEELLQERLHIQ